MGSWVVRWIYWCRSDSEERQALSAPLSRFATAPPRRGSKFRSLREGRRLGWLGWLEQTWLLRRCQPFQDLAQPLDCFAVPGPVAFPLLLQRFFENFLGLGGQLGGVV